MSSSKLGERTSDFRETAENASSRAAPAGEFCSCAWKIFKHSQKIEAAICRVKKAAESTCIARSWSSQPIHSDFVLATKKKNRVAFCNPYCNLFGASCPHAKLDQGATIILFRVSRVQLYRGVSKIHYCCQYIASICSEAFNSVIELPAHFSGQTFWNCCKALMSTESSTCSSSSIPMRRRQTSVSIDVARPPNSNCVSFLRLHVPEVCSICQLNFVRV